jgi:uncharacterized Tic20 family protein
MRGIEVGENSGGGQDQAGTQAQQRLAVTLRDGGTCTLYADRISIGPQEYSLADVAWAGLVIDPHVPSVPGAAPAPAVLLRQRDGRELLLSPAEPPAAWQLLAAVFAARPDLRPLSGAFPPPPPGAAFAAGYAGYGGYPPGYGPAYPPGYGPGYAPPLPRSSTNDTVLAGLAHLGVFLGGWILPLIIWLATRTSAPYASRQAKQAFFWQLFFFAFIVLVYIAFFGVFFVGIFSSLASAPVGPNGPPNPNPFLFAPFGALLIFYAAFFVAYIVNIIFAIIGAVQAFQGKPFHYPLLGWL